MNEDGSSRCRRTTTSSEGPAVGMEDEVETHPGDDLAQLQRRIDDLQHAAQRTKHPISVPELIRPASRCAVDQQGCGALPQTVCDHLTATGGYSSARVALSDENGNVPLSAEAGLADKHPARPVEEADADPEAMVVRIDHAGRDYGHLSVSTPAGLDPDSNERALLAHIAADIGFALHNIAKRRRQDELTERLGDGEEVFRDCFDGVSVGMAFIRSHDRPLVVNKAFADFLGYEKVELEKIPATEAMKLISRPEDHEMEMPLLHDLMNQRRSSYTIEKRFIKKNGDVIPGLLTTTFFFNSEGNFRFGVSSVQDISEHVSMREELGRAYGGAIDALTAALESRDPYTAGHQRRVTQLACAIADEMGLPAKQRMGLRVASILHDIGKIAIPAEILTKPYGVSETEYALIKVHPTVAYDILKEIRFPWPVADIVLQHHERLDGSGYPTGLEEGEILLEARILAVADTVEALASHRPYRAAADIGEVMRHISENRSRLFDSKVVTS